MNYWSEPRSGARLKYVDSVVIVVIIVKKTAHRRVVNVLTSNSAFF